MCEGFILGGVRQAGLLVPALDPGLRRRTGMAPSTPTLW